MSPLTLYVLFAVFCAAALTTTGTLTLDQLNVEFADLKKLVGTVYTRWGKNDCPSGTEIIYSGMIGGSWYSDVGGAANNLCLPPNPVYDNHANPSYVARVHGAEYETRPEPTQNLNPSCSVCRTSRSSVVMIPAANTCPTGWTLEYAGYLMAGYFGHSSATEYICVDSSFDYVPGSEGNSDGRLLFYVITKCDNMPCPPYSPDTIIICVVCTK